MKKTYQPFIIEKADKILDILKDDISPTEMAKNRLCNLLTEKFIKGELNPDDPVNMIFEEDELLSFVNICLVEKDIERLMELGLVGMLDDDDDPEPTYFVTKEGRKYIDELRRDNPSLNFE